MGTFCHELCQGLGVSLKVRRLKINRERGASLEAAAREGRYRVFAALDADYVVLGQHQDDQAETLPAATPSRSGSKGFGSDAGYPESPTG